MKQLLVTLCLIHGIIAKSQVLQGDAEGKSSILFAGKTIGIDMGKTALTFAMNNYSNEKKLHAKEHFIWGASVTSSVKESVASLFQSSNPSSGFSGTLLVGYSKTQVKIIDETAYDRELKRLEEMKDRVFNELLKITDLKVLDIANDENLPLEKKITLQEEAKMIITKKTDNKYIEEFDKLDLKYNTGKKLHDMAENLVIFSKASYGLYNAELEKLDKTFKESLLSEYRRYWLKRTTLYLSGTLGFNNYTFYNVNGNLSFNDRFADSNNYAKEFLAGINYEKGAKYKFGLSFGISYSDNISELEKQEFRNEQVESNNGSQVIRQLKKKEAYVGDFNNIVRYPVYVDFLNFFNPEQDRSLVLAWHSYFREKITSDQIKSPSTTTIGTGLYFFKQGGVFAGGVYIEAPDITNNIEKAKPKPDLKPLYKRLNLSVVGKFAFTSLLGY